MKQQIVFIHGGKAFSRYDDFLVYLQTVEIDDPLGLITQKKWKDSLREVFSETHEVYYPAMPNGKNAKYLEWKIWFERYREFLHDGMTLIGHSLGGYFLAKYLSEEQMPVKVRALYLVAAPFENDDFGGEDGGDFSFDTTKLNNLASQAGTVHIFHSEDDPFVPYSHALKYSEALPNAELVSFTNKGHFVLEEFPELVEHLRSHLE